MAHPPSCPSPQSWVPLVMSVHGHWWGLLLRLQEFWIGVKIPICLSDGGESGPWEGSWQKQAQEEGHWLSGNTNGVKSMAGKSIAFGREAWKHILSPSWNIWYLFKGVISQRKKFVSFRNLLKSRYKEGDWFVSKPSPFRKSSRRWQGDGKTYCKEERTSFTLCPFFSNNIEVFMSF